jgi:hypothetical protein
MRKFKFQTVDGEYTVTLKENGRRAKTGQKLTDYQLIAPDGTVVFSGDDLGCSPMNNTELKGNAIALLGFLTLKPGDTDDDYFKDYTPAQLAWCESTAAEDLRCIVDDREN